MMAVEVGPSIVGVAGAEFALGDEASLLPAFSCPSHPDFTVYFRPGRTPLSAWRRSRVERVEVERGGLLVRMAVTEWSARIDLEAREAVVHLPGPWPAAIESFFKTLVQLITLHDRSGLVFHAAAVACEGQGYLFVGPSGAGKTTVAGLSEEVGATVLSEEIACVCNRNGTGEYMVRSLPVRHRGRRVVTRCSVPLARVFTLQQGPTDRVVPLAADQGLRALLRTVSVGVRAPYFLRQAFVGCARLAAAVPVEELEFTLSTAFWRRIRETGDHLLRVRHRHHHQQQHLAN